MTNGLCLKLFTGLNPYSDDRYDWNIIQSFTNRFKPSTKKISVGRDKWLKESTQVFNLLCECWSFTPTARLTIQAIIEGLKDAVMAEAGEL